MPAWITSLLRELVCVPIAPSASRTTTSRPSSARRRATASPTTPAPITMQSTRSTSAPSLARGNGEKYGVFARRRAEYPHDHECRTGDECGNPGLNRARRHPAGGRSGPAEQEREGGGAGFEEHDRLDKP